MCNSKEDDVRLDVRREVAALSDEQIASIGIATAFELDEDTSEAIVRALDSYEKEIIRLRAVNGRLRNKNRNYRTGIKGLQRAHEATLHQLAAVKDTSEQYRELLVQAVEGLPQLCNNEVIGPYSPVRFNNDQRQTDAGWVVPESEQSIEYSAR